MPRPKPEPIEPALLYRACGVDQLPFTTTSELEDIAMPIGQERALKSVQFAVGMAGAGYNVFALGPSGLGKATAIRELVGREAAAQPVPEDWCYLYNFDVPHRPTALRLPAGRGAPLRKDMEQLVEDVRNTIPNVLESDDYQSRVGELEEELKERQNTAVNELREEAHKDRIALVETPGGFAFAPRGDKDDVLSPEQFEKLPMREKKRIQKAVARLQDRLQKLLRQFPVWRKETRGKVKALNREVAGLSVNQLIDDTKAAYHDLPDVLAYLDAVQQDIVEHVEDFQGQPEQQISLLPARPRRDPFERYAVNLLVDHRAQETAPVVYEDLPSHYNLVGRIEHQAQLGTLVTDFTLIRPGALHRANGGYLLLDAREVLRQPFAWESLKRTLQSGEIRVESLERMLSIISTVSLEPEPIPFRAKVVLIGDRLLYYLLRAYDPEFADLFKVAADFDEALDRGTDNDLLYARLIATMARREKLRPLDRAAVARVIEHGARQLGDAQKVSTHLRSLADLIREADYWAGKAAQHTIAAEHVEQATSEQVFRSERVRQRLYEEINRGSILIDTRGAAIGQVNGLSYLELGDFAFGLPARITATSRLGEGELIDIEREVELGGSIHSKGVLILASFLASRYAPGHPLSVSASVVFEQSYGFVEGDSASLAELCALLSSLAELPIRQSLAVTGSVNQFGQVQAIGGVNEKVEGFFDVCRHGELSGEQAVVIPVANTQHLMLRPDVVRAAEEDTFQVFAVETVDQAMELLTGIRPGRRNAAGRFPRDSINGRVEARLIQYSELRQAYAKGAEEKGH